MNKLIDEHIDKMIEFLRFGICNAPVNMITALKELQHLRVGARLLKYFVLEDKIMLNEFSKKDLKTGMIVETKEKSRYLVLIGNMKTFVYGSQNIIFISEDGFLIGDEYDNYLKQRKDNSFDVEKVYEGCVKGLDAMIELDDYKLIWERKPEVDWSKVAVDTKILVKRPKDKVWSKRYFSKFENDIVFAWREGKTSFSSKCSYEYISWEEAVLYEGNESLVGE